MNDFISDDDLQTFEGFLKYQAVDPAALTEEELTLWQGYFEVAIRTPEPKVGLMKLRRVPGEQKYAVAIQEGADLWLTMWVRCSLKGEVFVMYPRGDRDWDAHTSYHLDGTYHQKSFGRTFLPRMLQPLAQTFTGSQHLGAFGGHGKSSGAVCDPQAFDGVVIVGPGILGPRDGSIVIDLVEPGYKPKPDANFPERQVFLQNPSPSVIITICRSGQAIPGLSWPCDFLPL